MIWAHSLPASQDTQMSLIPVTFGFLSLPLCLPWTVKGVKGWLTSLIPLELVANIIPSRKRAFPVFILQAVLYYIGFPAPPWPGCWLLCSAEHHTVLVSNVHFMLQFLKISAHSVFFFFFLIYNPVLSKHPLHEGEKTTKQKTNSLMRKTKPDISCYKCILSSLGRWSMSDYPTSNYRL